jgi:hypothetical protein
VLPDFNSKFEEDSLTDNKDSLALNFRHPVLHNAIQVVDATRGKKYFQGG